MKRKEKKIKEKKRKEKKETKRNEQRRKEKKEIDIADKYSLMLLYNQNNSKSTTSAIHLITVYLV